MPDALRPARSSSPARWLALGAGATLAAAALVAGGAAQPNFPTFRTPQPPTPPPSTKTPSGEPPLVYAELTKWATRQTASDPATWSWQFTDGVHPLTEQALLDAIKIRPGASFDDASIVNGVANLGWDLISHSERAASVPGGTMSSLSGEMLVVEHWWFKRK